jgi:acyl-coenzyme A thioesterase PaaI-like protein
VTTDPSEVRDSLHRQSFLRLLGAEATVVEPGHVVIEVPFRADLCQQNGVLHAGVVTSVADSACGYAAMCSASSSR